MTHGWSWGAVIVAAGRGTRFGRPKQLLPLDGLPLAGWSIRTFAQMSEIADIVIVTEVEWIEAMQGVISQLVPPASPTSPVRLRNSHIPQPNTLLALVSAPFLPNHS